ncbi:MAG: monovalent cation/H+ antiporter complex subunit F [Fidelibacterota bacterium]
MAENIFNLAGIIAMLALLLAFFRMIKGPSAVDRVVALDAMTIISVSLIVFLAAFLGRIIYVDVALVYALISFIGVITIARYFERGL